MIRVRSRSSRRMLPTKRSAIALARGARSDVHHAESGPGFASSSLRYVGRRAREDTGRLLIPARPAQPLPPDLRTSHFPGPLNPDPTTPAEDHVDTEVSLFLQAPMIQSYPIPS